MEIGAIHRIAIQGKLNAADKTDRVADAPPKRADSVSISLESRARLAELADQTRGTRNEVSDGWDDRLNSIRRRIESGHFDTPEAKARIIDGLIRDL